MTKEAFPPNLSPNEYAVSTKYTSLPESVALAYSIHPECAANLALIKANCRGFLHSMFGFTQNVWERFESRLPDVHFVDKRTVSQPALPNELYVVVPFHDRFVSVLVRRGLPKEFYEARDNGQTVRLALDRLPEFLHPFARSVAIGGVNFSSPYLAVADVRWFYGVGYEVAAHMTDDIRGARRKSAAKLFGDRWEWDLRKLATDNKHNWTLFVDFGPQGDKTI